MADLNIMGRLFRLVVHFDFECNVALILLVVMSKLAFMLLLYSVNVIIYFVYLVNRKLI